MKFIKLLLSILLSVFLFDCNAQEKSDVNAQNDLFKYAGVYKCETLIEEDGNDEVVEVSAAFSVIKNNLILVYDEILYNALTIDSNKFDSQKLSGKFVTNGNMEGILTKNGKFFPKIGPSDEADKIIKEALMNQEEFNKFWDEFSMAVLKNDKQKVASMVKYPFIDGMGDVYYKKNSFSSKTKSEFLKKYDYLFDDSLKEIIKLKKPMQIGKNTYYIRFKNKYAGQETGWGEVQLDLVFEKINGKYYLTNIPYYA